MNNELKSLKMFSKLDCGLNILGDIVKSNKNIQQTQHDSLTKIVETNQKQTEDIQNEIIVLNRKCNHEQQTKLRIIL